jgi:ribosome maturation factor RimP
MANVVEIVSEALTADLLKQGFDLWDVIYEKQDNDMMLRVLVDREDGAINMDDLVMLTEFIGEKLDAINPDPFPAAYMLDISSPGAERELKRDKDFDWAIDRFIHLLLTAPMDGNNDLTGELLAVTEDQLTIAVTVKGKRTPVDVPRDIVKHANLTISQERVLKTTSDFDWALNKMVRVTTYTKVNGQKEFVGELTAFSDDELILSLEDESTVSIPRAAVAQARQSNNFD